MRLNIEATEPVHWSIKATVGGEDLRRFAELLFKPSNLFYAVVAALFRQEAGTPSDQIEGQYLDGVSSAMKKRRFLHG